MSHGFSRFGQPSARERFHQQTRDKGSLALFLPTILATLFLFTIVIALNKATSMANGKIIRLINVDDVYPTTADAESHAKKAFWETPPPPSPEAVLAARPVPPPPELAVEAPMVEHGPVPVPSVTPAPSPSLRIETNGLPMPAVAPDTSLPTPAPRP